jgi:hypothetical protein
MNLLQISPEKYNQLVFETGIGYLENYLNHSKLLVRDFSLHAGFWSWWKLQYRLVDEAFLRRYRNTNYPARQLVEFYIHSHLAMDKHIDRVVWKMVEEKRDEMIHKLIKKEVNNEH